MAETAAPDPARAALASLTAELTAALGVQLLEAVAAADMDEVATVPEGLLPAARLLQARGFNYLLDIGCTDHHPLTPRFEVSYHFLAIPAAAQRSDASAQRRAVPARYRVRVFPDDLNPVVPSLVALWPSANWPEREVYDLFGVRFDGHPDLRRILMPDNWEGHPLRKDYPLRGLDRRFAPGGRLGSVPPLRPT